MNNYLFPTLSDTLYILDSEYETLATVDSVSTITETETVESVKAKLNERMALARKYGMDEFSDEIASLLERLNNLRKR